MPEPSQTTVPAGAAIVEMMGYAQDDERGIGERRFVAKLVFPNGVPDLPLRIVWNQIPMWLIECEAIKR